MSITRTEWEKALRQATFPETILTAVGKQTKGVKGVAAKSVLIWLSSWANYDDGENAHPGIENLTRATGYGESTVKLALRIGVETGWLRLEKQGGGRSREASVYALTIPTSIKNAGAPEHLSSEEGMQVLQSTRVPENAGAETRNAGAENVNAGAPEHLSPSLPSPSLSTSISTEAAEHECDVWCEARGSCSRSA